MEKIGKLRNLFKQFNLDGYIIPKNNNFFGEYVPAPEDNLKYISNFSGSAGFAIILKDKNLMFVDGRYTDQANIQCEKNYKIFTIPKKYPFNVFNNKNLNLGFDPRLHTENSLNRLFKNSFIKLKPINENLIDLIWKRKKDTNIKPFYLIKDIKRVLFRNCKNFIIFSTLDICLGCVSTVNKYKIFIFKNNCKTSRTCKI